MCQENALVGHEIHNISSLSAMIGHAISDRICNRWSILRSKGKGKENWNVCEEWSFPCAVNSLKSIFLILSWWKKNVKIAMGILGILVIRLQQEASCYLGMTFCHQQDVFWSLTEMKDRQIWRRRASTYYLL